jgi:hypothetical protein
MGRPFWAQRILTIIGLSYIVGIMKTFTFNKEDQQRIVDALKNHISDIRLYDKKERNRLRNKTTKNLAQRKNDQMIIDRAEEKIVGIERIIDEINKEKI